MKSKISVPVASWRNTYFTWASIVAMLLVLAGFARTYYLKAFFATTALPTLLHIHGTILTLWFVLFFVQVRLVAVHRVDFHRLLGICGVVLATFIVLVSSAVAIHATRRDFLTDPRSNATLSFLAFLLLGELLPFVGFFVAALLFRQRSDYHKRFMLLASCSFLGAAIIRLPFHFIQVAGLWSSIAMVETVPVIFILFDTAQNRRLHAAFLWGGLLFVSVLPALVFLSRTQLWIEIAKRLVL
jgi:hypothetical protein